MLSAEELLERLNNGDESTEIEAKAGREVGTSLMETVCAMSNEPGRGGGYILLGVSPMAEALFPSYEVVGVAQPDKVQADLISACASVFNVVVRPQISSEPLSGKTVLVVQVPEAQPHEKPVYFRNKGLPRGAFRRFGPTDAVCTDDDLQVLFQGRDHRSFDEGAVEECVVEDLDTAAIAEYRRARAEANPNAPELGYSDEELLLSLSCVARRPQRLVPTIAGVLLFGKRSTIRRVFSLMRLDYIRVPGREWVRDPDSRFDTLEILDPILLALPRAINAVLDDIPKAFHLPASAIQRRDVPLIPQTAIREALVNAVMHRSYRQRSAVQIIRYANRLEIRNPGHSLVPDDRLGEPGSVTRNEKIAAVLHETRYAETKGSGIRAIRESMAQANLAPPTFESDREKDCFVVTFLFHHFLNEEDVRWLGQFSEMELSEDEQKALVYVRETGAINNAAYRDINRVEALSASGHLRRLRDLGLLEQKGKSVGTYYEPTWRLLKPGDKRKPQSAQPTGPTLSATREPTGFKGNLQGLPTGLAEAVRSLGTRSAPADTRRVILELCRWRPLSSEELADIVGRNQHYLLTTLLRPMIRDGDLEYVYPDQPAHPQQAYRTRGDPDKAGA
jgi:ATP-dependent DNA helicase RecG